MAALYEDNDGSPSGFQSRVRKPLRTNRTLTLLTLSGIFRTVGREHGQCRMVHFIFWPSRRLRSLMFNASKRCWRRFFCSRTILVQGLTLEFSVASAPLLGGGVERRVEQPVPANPPGPAATSDDSDYTYYTEVEEEEITRTSALLPHRAIEFARAPPKVHHSKVKGKHVVDAKVKERAPPFQSAEVAVDVRLVCPVQRDGRGA